MQQALQYIGEEQIKKYTWLETCSTRGVLCRKQGQLAESVEESLRSQESLDFGLNFRKRKEQEIAYSDMRQVGAFKQTVGAH